MGRPREHDPATGEALLDAAEAQLAEGGTDEVSVRGVARRVGVSTRAVYTLFGSKAGLVAALAVRGYTLLVEGIRALPVGDDPAEGLVAVGVGAFRPFAIARPHLFRLTFERVPAGVLTDPYVAKAAESAHRELVVRIRRAQEAGVVDARPVEEIAFAFHSLCQGLAAGELSREPPPVGAHFWKPIHGLDAEHLWQGALAALVRGLAP